MVEISQGWDTRDSFLLPILSKHRSHPLSVILYEEGNGKIFQWQEKKTNNKKKGFMKFLFVPTWIVLEILENKNVSPFNVRNEAKSLM